MKATLFLIIVCVIAYPFGLKYDSLLAFSYYNLMERKEWWTLITATLIHGGILHLLGNMLFLFFFGKALEEKIGSAKLLLCFFTGGVLSLLSGYFFYSHNQPVVGASGAICTLIGTLMIYSPWRISFLLNFFPMPLGVAAFTYMFLNVYLAYKQHSQPTTGMQTAYQLHVVGFIVGVFFGITWNKEWKTNLLISIVSFIGFWIIILLFFDYFRPF